MMAVETMSWNVQDYLKTPEDRAAMLEILFEDDPAPGEVAHMLGEVARADNMSAIARAAGISREGLYKALSRDGNPGLATLMGVLKAFGLRLAVTPIGGKSEAEDRHAA